MSRFSGVLRWLIIGGAVLCLLLTAAVVYLVLQFRTGVSAGRTRCRQPWRRPPSRCRNPSPRTASTCRLASRSTSSRLTWMGRACSLWARTGPSMSPKRGAGRVLRLEDANGDGAAESQQVAASGLAAPSGLAFYEDGSLYVAEPGRVVRFTERSAEGTYGGLQEIISGIPTSGHNTRTLLFSPDGQYLYVSIGSSCNTCVEEDPAGRLSCDTIRMAAASSYMPSGCVMPSGWRCGRARMKSGPATTAPTGWATTSPRDGQYPRGRGRFRLAALPCGPHPGP